MDTQEIVKELKAERANTGARLISGNSSFWARTRTRS